MGMFDDLNPATEPPNFSMGDLDFAGSPHFDQVASPDVIRRTELAVLSIDLDATRLESVQAAITAVDNLKRVVRELDEQLKARLIPYIQRHGEFSIGDNRYHVGPDKETKCIDMPATVRTLLGGATEVVNPATGEVFEVSALTDCLSKNAFKPAATIKAIPPADAEKLFVTTVGTVLKVQVANDKFLK